MEPNSIFSFRYNAIPIMAYTKMVKNCRTYSIETVFHVLEITLPQRCNLVENDAIMPLKRKILINRSSEGETEYAATSMKI